MKKLLFKLGLIIIPLELIIIVINLIVDPANIVSETGKKYAMSIADILSIGHNVDNISNYDERLLQEYFLTKQKSKPDIIILGSSRVMEINSSFYPNQKLLNLGVSHANINDLIAITGIIDSFKLFPKTVVINVDPFLICMGGSNEWESIGQYYKYFQKKYNKQSKGLNIGKNKLNKYYTIASFEYFRNSLAYFFKGGTKRIIDIGIDKPKIYGRLSDGSIYYSYAYTHPDTALIRNIASGTAKENVPKIDPFKIEQLNDLLEYYHNKHIDIQLIMLPFHLDYYNEVNLLQKNIFKNYENFFKNYALQKKYPIKGSLSSQLTQTTISDFYDTYHCSGNSIKKILIKN